MERRLAAILSLDMVAYSRLVEADETGTLTRLGTLINTLVEPAVERHHGRVVKGTGDGVLAEFAGAGEAIDCAAEIQQATAEHEAGVAKSQRIEFRIGINVGEIYAEDGDIYGNGVIVAARLQSLADPGGILVSASAREQMQDSEHYGFENLGAHLVKNMKAPVRVYRLLPDPPGKGILPLLKRLRKRKIVQWAIAYFAGAWIILEMFDLVAEQFLLPVWVRQGATVLVLFGLLATIVLAWYHGERGRQKVGWSEVLVLSVLLLFAGQSIWLLKGRNAQLADDAEVAFQFRSEPLPRHSVAVLPCLNISNDENQAYFADSLAAELITRLAAVRGLRIPSHTSSFSFRGKNVTMQAVAAALRVRHVLECDVSGDESRVRIGARLIDTDSGYTIWSDSYDHLRTQLFDAQQDVVQAVVQSLEIRLGDRERRLVSQRWTESTEAYDEFLRGIHYQPSFPTEADLAVSARHLGRAIELDPEFGRAYARLAMHWVIMSNFGYAPATHAQLEIDRLANKAIALDGDLWEAYWALGWGQLAIEYAWRDAELSFRKAIDLAPGEWAGYHSLGFVLGVLGHYDEAMTAARIATGLDPLAYWPRRGIEFLYFRQRQYQAAMEVLLEIAARDGWNPFLRANMARMLALTGQLEKARSYLLEVDAANSQDPNVNVFQALVHAALGEHDQALALVEPWLLRRREDPNQYLAATLAFVYATLGQHDLAMELLLEGRRLKEVDILFLDDPAFDNMREDPRFTALIQELNLPENIYLSAHNEALAGSGSH